MRTQLMCRAVTRVLLALVFGAFVPLSGQEAEGVPTTPETSSPAPTPSKIIRTTLSAGSALVTREVAIPATTGLHTVRVGPLPRQIQRDSVQASGADHLRVVSVQVEERSGGDHASPEYRALEERLEGRRALRNDLALRRTAALDRRERYASLQVVLRKNLKSEGEPEPAPIEPSRWQHFLDLVSRGMAGAGDEATGLELGISVLDRQLDKLSAELGQIASPSRRQSVTAILTIQNLTGTAGALEVSYELPNALWYPEYSVRIDREARVLEISSYGVVHQATGEEWPEVPVHFTTALPQRGASMPELASYRIRRDRYQDVSGYARDEDWDAEDDSMADARGSGERRELSRRASPRRGRVAASAQPIEGFDRFRFSDGSSSTSGFIELSDEAIEGVRTFGDHQRLQRFILPEERVSRERKSPSKAGSPRIHAISRHAVLPNFNSSRGFLRTFTSVHPEAVPSDGAPHRLLIGRIELPFIEERTAVPELMAHVFRRLRASLAGDDPCLAGSAAVFMDGVYLGSSRIPTTAPGEELILDLGVDDQIEIVRRQEDREEEVGVFSKARRYHTTVTLDLVNHHAEAKTIDLRERMPFTEEDRISIDLDDDETRPMPTRIHRNSGLLDWDLTIPAGGKRTVTLRYSIDAPRSFQLTRTPAPQRLEEDDR